ncbi:MAG: DEAD/DEAH box helicase [Waddliaceae bacterium]
MTFDSLQLHPQILKAVAESGYTEATKIQIEAIPKILEGFDIRASAQTGTGKTAAFLLPILNNLVEPSPKPGKGPRVLIIAPTRELAMQIASQSEKYSKYLKRTKTVCISGGVPYHAQMRSLSRHYDILIATPGRLIDYIHRGKIDFSRLEMLILDEADRMLDMGFIDPIKEIVAATPTSRQTLLFSATLQGPILRLSEQFLKDPIEIVIHSKREKHENISQKIHYTDDLYHKNRLLNHILSDDEVENTIVFTSTKRHAAQLVLELHDKGHLVAALHGDMNQRQRTRTITELRNGKINILVATDVAARGIDVQSITHVINFDLPRNIEDYVHRIGRTGRAGAKGTALSFASRADRMLVRRIEEFTGQQIAIEEVAGLEPKLKALPTQPNRNPRSRQNGNRRFSPKAARPARGRAPRRRSNA